jgi:hypothetical protein
MHWTMRTLAASCCVAAATAGQAVRAVDAAPRVSLEVLTQPGLPLTASQQWYKVLTDLGISGLQIRSANARDEAAVTEHGTKAAPQYHVTGILSSDNVLYLPGGKFGPKDTAALRKWLTTLRDLGPEGLAQPPAAFGLLASQLAAATADLKRPLTTATKGASAATVVSDLAGRLQHPLVMDAAARSALAEVAVAEELRGLSAGTALAIALRPAGLVLVPQRAGRGALEYRIAPSERGGESWPIGWKPKKRPAEVLPALFEFLNVEITGIPVSEALVALEGRLKVPLVFDRNALALHGVDPAKVPAEVPSGRMSYSQTLRRVLSQARLKYDLRVDEAEKPFLWITTVKPAE